MHVTDLFQDAYDHYGNNGRRVIGFAKRDFRAPLETKFNVDEPNFPFTELTFIGIAAIMDPPRPDTANAIMQCKNAGIKVFMVTAGDHPSTATAIAREIGLIGHQEKVIHEKSRRRVAVNVPPENLEEEETKEWATVHGRMLPEMSDADWNELLEHNYIVFARTTPEQKLLIVEKCQERGEVVCVTGDGVNDAPALKRANIGVAMGVTGSDVAKQAADVVLMDDNFASIVKGIEEGRLLFDNLRKTIAYTLTHTIPEVVPIVLNFLFGIPMAITSLQASGIHSAFCAISSLSLINSAMNVNFLKILSIDLGTEITPAISLAYENPERDIMSKPPRKKTTRLVSFALLAYSYILAAGIIIGWATAAYLYVYWYNGISFKDLFFSASRYFKYNPVGNFTSNDNVYDEALQVDIRNQAASAYYLTLVMSQNCRSEPAQWTLSATAANTHIEDEHSPLSAYTKLDDVMTKLLQAWFFSLGAGICLWVFNETRKYFIRNWPYNNIVRIFKWYYACKCTVSRLMWVRRLVDSMGGEERFEFVQSTMRAVRRIKRSCDLKNEVKKSGVKAGSSTDNANRNLSSVAINLYAAIVLFLIVIVMCTVTFFEEKKARNVVRGFSNLLPAKCTVIRESRQMTIDSCDIVVGDLVIVKSGSRQSTGLKVEASSITGEAEPIEVHAESVAEHIGVFDAGNVTFNGSFCVDGEGIGICIRTGQATAIASETLKIAEANTFEVIGQIAALTTEQKQESSSLQIEISRFVKFVTVSALIMGAIIFIIGGFINKWHDIVNLFISGFLVVIVANVPQGLPATVTSELTIIARRMASKNVYMKKLDVIESFGATTVIASDKTGTLTMNKMTVTDVWCGRNYVSGEQCRLGIPEVKYKTLHTITASKERSVMVGLDDFDKPLPDLITIMAICNKAEFEAVGQTIHFGDEQLTLSRRTLSKIDGGENLWRPTGRRRLHSVAPAADDLEAGGKLGRRRHSTMSGAPEVIMKKCSQFALADGCISIDEGTEMEFQILYGRKKMICNNNNSFLIGWFSTAQDAYDHFGNSGRRVIGFAMKRFPFNSNMRFSSDGSDFPLEDFTFVGLVAIMDPPRPDTSDAIERCKRAGIKVFMVTGDHPSTATAVAKEIGLIGPPKEITVQKTKRSISMSFAKDEEEDEERDWAVVHGSLLPDLTEAHWDELLEFSYIVFARQCSSELLSWIFLMTTPEQKLLIVEKCQHRGEVVTVTGDGVNDAPALKKANVGVAMGITGSDVAKQAADIVLMDDNFASIVKGVEEGRLLFDNLRKTIAYTLTHTMPEVVTIVFNFVVGVPMALTTLLILSVDLGTELAPAISLAYENAEIDIMEKAPRKRTTRLVSIAMLAYSYAIAGGMVIIGSSAAYLYTYAYDFFYHKCYVASYHGIDLRDIFFSADDYFKHNAIGNFTSNGLVFNEEQQVEIQAQGCFPLVDVQNSTYFNFSAWNKQSSRLLNMICLSHHVNVSIYAVIIEVLLVLLFVYTPGINFVMGARPPPFQVSFQSSSSIQDRSRNS
ncbi:unnamed protein product [Toxocara canis]|uniref:Cation_ATPase_C domain-containing protein n=1 Tax=Toxocara canis TaxID=6265 RepID=A0A183UB73_TOXCA|nr:unnamed protein product [Toxocara canis]